MRWRVRAFRKVSADPTPAEFLVAWGKASPGLRNEARGGRLLPGRAEAAAAGVRKGTK